MPMMTRCPFETSWGDAA